LVCFVQSPTVTRKRGCLCAFFRAPLHWEMSWASGVELEQVLQQVDRRGRGVRKAWESTNWRVRAPLQDAWCAPHALLWRA
jgi:hypothetical protein